MLYCDIPLPRPPSATVDADLPPASLAVYLPSPEDVSGLAVIVCPGGGYTHLAMEKCGHRPARWLASLGHVGIVLPYRHAPFRHPVPLEDARAALAITHAHATEWGLRDGGIGMMGFSAGGHLVASAATFPDGEKKLRPAFTLLIYPVIAMIGEEIHQGSVDHLLGGKAPENLRRKLSPNEQVTPNTAPAFLVHAGDDEPVPVSNSLRYYQALQTAGIEAEMHLYAKGGHGFGMGKMHPWTELAARWLARR